MDKEKRVTHEETERKIFKLLQRINVELSHGDPEEANRLRDKIAELEKQLQREKPCKQKQ